MGQTYSQEAVKQAIANVKARKEAKVKARLARKASEEVEDTELECGGNCEGGECTPTVEQRREAARRAVARIKARRAKEAAAEKAMAVKQAKIEKIASNVADVIKARMERILADTEEIVKDNVPARYVSAALTKLEKSLVREGISATFDKKISRQTMRKTAGIDCTAKDVDEACSEFTKAVVAEAEDTLDQADAKIAEVAGKHFTMRRLATRRMRRAVEAKLNDVMKFNLEGVEEDVEE